MTDRERVISDIERCICHEPYSCKDCSKYGGVYALRCMEDLLKDALELLKEQDGRYRVMVVEWLREMAHNNYQEVRKMDFLDAILEIRERAMIGLENYFKDYKKEKGGEVG